MKKAFQDLKNFLSTPPILTNHKEGMLLILYLSLTDKAISSILILEGPNEEKSIYFVNKVLKGVDLCY